MVMSKQSKHFYTCLFLGEMSQAEIEAKTAGTLTWGEQRYHRKLKSRSNKGMCIECTGNVKPKLCAKAVSRGQCADLKYVWKKVYEGEEVKYA